MKKLKLLFTGFALLGGVLSAQAQNLLSGAIPTVNTDTYFTSDSGWKFYNSSGTDKSSDFYSSSKDPKARARAPQNCILSGGSKYTGSCFLIRWDGFSNAVYSYPVTLEANKFYTFTMNVVHWNNNNNGVIAGLNANVDGRGTVIASVTATSINSASNGSSNAELKSYNYDARITKADTYYVTFKNGDNGIYCIADNLSLVDADISVYESNWQTAYDAAVEARDDASYTNITGNERDDLQTEIGKTKPSTKDGYFSAMVALENATTTFTSAKNAYDFYKGIKDENTAMGATTLAVEPTTAAEATAGGNTLKVNQYNYINSIYTGDVTDLYVGTWTTKSNFDEVTNNEHWSGNSTKYFNKWAAKSTTSTLSQTMTLPAGSYALKVAGRGTGPVLTFSDGTTTKNFQLSGGEGLGINVDGQASYDAEDAKGFANTTGRGWEWRFIKLTLADATNVTVTLQINRSSDAGWGSFADFTVLTTPLTESLNRYNLAYTAATTAKASDTYENVLGGSEEAALTEAIAADASLDKTSTTDLDAATATLTSTTSAFTNATTVANYNRLAAAIAKATSISVDHSAYDVTSSTTASEALTNANALYSSMFNDLKTAKAKKTLGFETGEYAPYNNVNILVAWAKADAITTVAEATSSALDDAITALNGASWSSANAADVNAIYDGTLKDAPIQATSSNVVLPGWVTKSGNTRQTFKGTGGDGKACLADADDEVGLFVHPGTYTYGETTGYTMPLKEDVVYVARAKYCSWNANDNNNFTLTIKKGGTTIGTKSFGANKTASTVEHALKEVKLFFIPTEDGDHTLTVVTDGNTFMTDFYIEKAAPENITISAAGMATYVSDYDLDYSGVSGLKAYKATVSGTTATFTQVTTVPAGEGVLLEGAAGSYDIPVTTGVTAWTDEDNAFIRGTGAAVATEAGSYKNYILSTDNDGNNVGFYYANGETVPTNRAYLQSTAAAARLAIVFADETTGIKSLTPALSEGEGAVYNLRGQRISKPAKGLYIMNGKKVIIK